MRADLFSCSKNLIRTALFLGMTACVSEGPRPSEMSIAALEELKETLNASEFHPCSPIASEIRLPVPVRTARIQFNDDKASLVYEGFFREAIKTIWQPLNEDYELNGDGVVVGSKGIPFVTDFETHSDSAKGFWTTYRSKIPGSEKYSATVEYVPSADSGSKVSRTIIPVPPDASVQRIWIIPLPQPSSPKANRDKQRGLAHVFVKTVSTLGNTYDVAEGEFSWFLLYAPKGMVKKLGEFREHANTRFLVEKFLLTENADDPTAIGLTIEDRDEFAIKAQNSGPVSQIIAMRPFIAGNPQVTLHQENSNLSSLAVYSENGSTDSIYLAWVKNHEDATPPSVHFTPRRIDVSQIKAAETPFATRIKSSPKKFESKRGSKGQAGKRAPTFEEFSNRQATIEIKTNYIPSRLNFMAVSKNGKNLDPLLLTWLGGTEENLAFVASRVDGSRPASQGRQSGSTNPRTLAFASRENLGRLLSATLSPSEKGKLYFTFLERAKGEGIHPATIKLCTVDKKHISE